MIGIDLASIKRFERFYEKHGVKAYEKFLRSEEIALVSSPKTAAGFWALKEAVAKALGCGICKDCTFKDIWIRKNTLGKPYISLSKSVVNKFKIQESSVSISHDGGYAIATAYLKSEDEDELFVH